MLPVARGGTGAASRVDQPSKRSPAATRRRRRVNARAAGLYGVTSPTGRLWTPLPGPAGASCSGRRSGSARRRPPRRRAASGSARSSASRRVGGCTDRVRSARRRTRRGYGLAERRRRRLPRDERPGTRSRPAVARLHAPAQRRHPALLRPRPGRNAPAHPLSAPRARRPTLRYPSRRPAPLSSRGLGRRPLTAETGVRIPVAVLRKRPCTGVFVVRRRCASVRAPAVRTAEARPAGATVSP